MCKQVIGHGSGGKENDTMTLTGLKAVDWIFFSFCQNGNVQ